MPTISHWKTIYRKNSVEVFFDPTKFKALKEGLIAFMMGRNSSHTDVYALLPPTRKQVPPTTNRVKKKALKKEYKIAYKIAFTNYIKKKDLAYSIVYEACAKNATTIITKSAYIKNCLIKKTASMAIGPLEKTKEVCTIKDEMGLSTALNAYDTMQVRVKISGIYSRD
jgi:hypothetical protein